MDQRFPPPTSSFSYIPTRHGRSGRNMRRVAFGLPTNLKTGVFEASRKIKIQLKNPVGRKSGLLLVLLSTQFLIRLRYKL